MCEGVGGEGWVGPLSVVSLLANGKYSRIEWVLLGYQDSEKEN